MSNKASWPAALLSLLVSGGIAGCETKVDPVAPAPVAVTVAPAAPARPAAKPADDKGAAVAVSVDGKGGSIDLTTKGGDKISVETSTDSKK